MGKAESEGSPAARGPLPPGVRVEPQGRGEYRAVLLDIEGTTFELHPEDAEMIGFALVKVASALADEDADVC